MAFVLKREKKRKRQKGRQKKMESRAEISKAGDAVNKMGKVN